MRQFHHRASWILRCSIHHDQRQYSHCTQHVALASTVLHTGEHWEPSPYEHVFVVCLAAKVGSWRGVERSECPLFFAHGGVGEREAPELPLVDGAEH